MHIIAISLRACDTYSQRQLRPEGPMEVFKSAMTAIEDADKNTETYKNAMSVYQLSVARADDRAKGRAPRPTKNKPGQAQRRQ